MKKFILATFAVITVLFFAVAVSYADDFPDLGTGNGYTVLGTANYVNGKGEVDSANALTSLLAELTSSDHSINYGASYGSSTWYYFMPNYIVNIKYNSAYDCYGIFLQNNQYSGWLHTGSRKAGLYMLHCPADMYEPNLLSSIVSISNSISSKVTVVNNNLTNNFTSLLNKLSTLDTRLSTIKDYLVSDDTETGNTYTVATWVKRCYNTLSKIEEYLVSADTENGNLYTIATWAKRIYNRMGDMISAINSLTVGFDASDVHLSVDASTLTFNLNAFCFSPASGSTFETLAIPYDTATDIVARLNTDYMGQKCTILLRSGGTTTAYFRSAYLNSNGYITAKMTNGVNYYLCDNSQVIYVADSTTNYGSKTISKLNSAQNAIVNALTAIGTQLDNLPSHDNSDVVSALSNIGTKLDALPIPDNTGIENTLSSISTALASNHTALINAMSMRFQGVTSLLSGISTKMDNLSGDATDLTGVTTRLDTIIEELQSTSGEFSCEHTYAQEMTQAPTCILPGLQVSTCSKCGSSYSEIVSALGHDWQCTDHVEDVTDPNTGEVTETGYDIYTCSRCGDTYNDYSGSGAPDDYGDTSISKIIVSLFSKLGTFAGKLVSWIIGLFDKLLGGLDDLITRFSELTAQITGFGGDYPTWLSGFWGILPQELQLALGFSFVCLFVGLIGRKLFFA